MARAAKTTVKSSNDERDKANSKKSPKKTTLKPSDDEKDATLAELKAKAAEADNGKAKSKKLPKKGGYSLVTMGVNSVTTFILGYGVWIGKVYWNICYPSYPEVDPKTHEFLEKFDNVFQPGGNCHARIWLASEAFPASNLSVPPQKRKPLVEFNFTYEFDGFVPIARTVKVNITADELIAGENVILSADAFQRDGYLTKATGNVLKKMARPYKPPKYNLLTGAVCAEDLEPSFGNDTHIARGVPQLQVRLVYDTTRYPPPWKKGMFVPKMLVDEFWMTDDALVKLNATGENAFETEITFSMMSIQRHRFQRYMEKAFKKQADLLGADSQEMLEVRDLFANTSPYLLITTLVVSILHMVFEFLAFKNDVIFFKSCDTESLNKFISVQSIAVGIVMQVVILLHLYDEGANILVVVTCLCSILIDAWKVQRAMKITWISVLGFLPLPRLEAKVKLEKAEDFDSIAMRWLGLALLPLVAVYAVYTLIFDCHKGWYSYFLTVGASSVYSLGFILMTPQVFINYKHKSVAYLPWKKFIYKAINTFIDDLFAFIIKMPTMHRLSCFRDDIVFFVYLYQRQIYAIDKSRSFDDDGLVEADGDVQADGHKKKIH